MTASRIVTAAFVGLWSISAFAQVPPATTNNPTGPDQQGPTTTDPNAPKTGAPAAAEYVQPPATGPDIVDDPNATPEQKASAEYSGPAVLSRAISASEPMNPKNVKFTPSAGVEYVYNSGLSGVAIQPNGQLPNGSSSGVQLSYSLSGTKVYKKDLFRLSFTGAYYHYGQSGYDGSSNSLGLTWQHELSRHLTFGVRVSGSEFDQNNMLLSGAQYVDSGAGTTLVTSTPATEAFDGRVISFMTEGNVTYHMTSRLSINLSGAGFMTRRASSSLYGDTGYQAGADLAYRTSRHVTIGAYYSNTHFDFIGIYGATNINTLGVTYSIAFGPTTELITRVGASRLDTIGLTNVSLNPLLALLFGTTSAKEAISLVNYTPDINMQLRHQVSKVTLSLAYARGVTPGNGIILTSIRETASFGADYKVGRNWNFSSSAGYDSLTGYGADNQKYTSVFAGASVYRTVLKNLSWHGRVEFHHYLFDNTGFLRNTFLLSTGLAWSPGNLQDRIW